MEVVVEAVLDRRAEGHLDLVAIELLRRLGQHMGGVVAEQVEGIGALRRDDLDPGVAVDRPDEVGQLAVDLDGERGLGEAGADRLGDVGAGDGSVILTDAAVG